MFELPSVDFLDGFLIAFVVLTGVLAYWVATYEPPKPPAPDFTLIVFDPVKSPGRIEFNLKQLREVPGLKTTDDGDVSLPLDALVKKAGILSSSLLVYSVGSNKVQKIIRTEQADSWSLLLAKGGEQLNWCDDGPIILKGGSDRIPRLSHIEGTKL